MCLVHFAHLAAGKLAPYTIHEYSSSALYWSSTVPSRTHPYFVWCLPFVLLKLRYHPLGKYDVGDKGCSRPLKPSDHSADAHLLEALHHYVANAKTGDVVLVVSGARRSSLADCSILLPGHALCS